MSLGDFNKRDRGGRAVVTSKVEMRGMSGGLNPAMEVDPVELYTGQRVRVICDMEVDFLGFPRVKGTDYLARDHILKLVEGRIAVLETDCDLDRDCVAYLNDRQETVARLFHEQEFEEQTAETGAAQQAFTDQDDDLAPVDPSDAEWEADGRRTA